MGEEKFKGFAIVVGVGAADIAVTADDARSVSRVLGPSFGAYEKVITLTRRTATTEKLKSALAAAERWSAENPTGTVLFYFSGHGRAFPRDGRLHEHYLELWSGPDKRIPDRLPARLLEQRLRRMGCRNSLVILDCCFAGTTRIRRRRPPHSKSTSGGQFAQQLEGHLLLASSLAHQRSFAHPERGSIFTECLVEALQGKATTQGDHARVFDVLSYVFREVPKRAARDDEEQAPFVSSRVDFEENFSICRMAQRGAIPLPVSKPRPLKPEVNSRRWLMLLQRDPKQDSIERLEKRLRTRLKDASIQLIRARDAEPVLECTGTFDSFLRCRELLRRGQFSEELEAPIVYLVGTAPPGGSPADPRWGNFNLLPHRSGRRLWATVRKHDDWAGYFEIALEVSALKGAPPLSGKVTFFLHDSYSRSVQSIRVRNSRAVWKVSGWGSYTVGAEVHEGRGPPLRLELDLGNIPKVPRGFIDDA